MHGTECPIPCNLCGVKNIKELSSRDRKGNFLRTTICRQCGLVWSNPRPSEKEINRYYSDDYRLDYKGRKTPSLYQTSRAGLCALNRYAALRVFLRPGDTILDVGAGGGELVYVLRRLGFDAQGIEPNKAYAKHARLELEVPIKTGFVQTISFPNNSFSIMTMYHTLEHVEDPYAILLKLKQWLKSDGILIVEVPNVEATCQAPQRRFHFAHFYSFNKLTLQAIGQKAGLVPIQSLMSSDGGNLTCIFKNTKSTKKVISLTNNYSDIVHTLRHHRMLLHYLSLTPYIRVIRRLRTHFVDIMYTRGCTKAVQVLDKLLLNNR